jgi:hypothetical protein
MYFIVKGKVLYEVNEFDCMIPVKEIRENYYFGE